MSASPTDILTALKNAVTALSQLGQTILNVNGQQRSSTVATTAATLVVSGQGRLCKVAVIAGSGSNTGAIYDSAATGTLTNQMCLIPTVPGVYDINIPFTNGIVMVLGTSMTANCTYSMG